MPGKDDGAAQPALGTGGTRGGSADDVPRGNRGAGEASKPLSGAHSEERGGLIALGNQILGGAVDQHDAGTRGRPFEPPAILRAPSSLLSHPLFLHPVPQLGAPIRAPSLPPSIPAPLTFPVFVGAHQPPVLADITVAQTQKQTQEAPQTTQPPAQVPSPNVELSVTSSAIDATPTSIETASSASAVSVDESSASPPEIASTTSASAPDTVPLAFAPAESLVNTSLTSPDILPVTNTGVGVGGKVAAACVIGAVFLLLLNWAFWLVIRRRRRARRSMPAHWDFGAPSRAKDVAWRDSEDAFAHAEDERVAKDGMDTVPV